MSNPALAEFLAHSVELESEALQRYGELAAVMATHHNGPVAGFFRDMAEEAARHLAEVEAIAGALELPELEAWDFDWPDSEAPETASYEALHYRMSLAQAMALALQNERAAERYYRSVAETSSDSETARVAARFAEEEARHGAALQARMAALQETPVHQREDDDDPHMPE
jgi:rubrerythrin